MRKFITQISAWLLAIIILSFVLTTVTFNIILAVVKPGLLKNATADFKHDVSIKHIIYLFPNRLIFKDFVIKEKPDTEDKSLFVLPAVTGRIAVLKSFANRQVLFSEVDIYKAQGSWPLFCRFVSKNWAAIVQMVAKSPKGDVKVKLTKGKFLLNDLADSRRYLLADGVCAVKGSLIEGRGTLHFEKYIVSEQQIKRVSHEKILGYGFNTEWAGDVIFLNSFVMEGNNVYCKLWGDFHNTQLQLNGFTFVDSQETRKGAQKDINILDRIKLLMGILKGRTVSIDGLSAKSIYLTDIDSLININLPTVEIQKCDFNFNNAPISLKGKIFATDPVVLELGMSAFPVSGRGGRQGNLLRSDVGLKGKLQDDAFWGDTSLNLQFDPQKTSNGLSKINVNLQKAQLDYAQYPIIKPHIGRGNAIWKIRDNDHRIILTDLTGRLDLGEKDTKAVAFRSGFYQGVLEGDVKIDTHNVPFNITSEMKIKDTHTEQMGALIDYFSKISGKSEGEMTFHNIPDMKLDGNIRIREGKLKDFKFFKWLAKTFVMPSVEEVEFEEMDLRFLVSGEKTGLEDISLNARDLKLTGYYLVNKHSLVSSKLSLFFSRDLLASSPKFKAILRLFPEDLSYIDFNFQLSGNKNAVNFLWLPSESKNIIEKRIPDFIERSIERKIDEKLDAPEPVKQPEDGQEKKQ